MDDINPEMPQVDVAVVIGANDVVNPAARHDNEPDLRHADHRRRQSEDVIAIKRSMNPGFAGIENELYYADNTLMLFGDAKVVIGEVCQVSAGKQNIH